jgi:protein SCO1/2
MKTSLMLVLSAAALVGSLRAVETPAACCVAPAAPAASAACCVAPAAAPAPATAAKPSCCVEEKPGAPLSNLSLYQLGATWTDDAGRAVSLTSLRGRPVVLAMFFAQCEYACPVLVQDIKRLLAALPAAAREKAQLVLVTFDTVRDTPAALRAFRERMALDANWTLLRAEPDAVQELAMLLGVKFKQDARGQFAHSNLLTLLNADGEIVHQHAGLNGDISEAARLLALTAK